jgi:guanylate kinase
MGEGRGRLVVISGPSGAGKTSVCRQLKEDPRVEFSVSATTRLERPGERDGVDYHFLTAQEFDRRERAGEFLESASYNGNRYGTLRQPMEEALAAGRIFLLEIEVQGTRQLRERNVPGEYIFIVPPSLAVLRARLVARGTNTAEEIEQRMRIAAEEMEAASLYDHVVENAVLDDTVAAVKARIGL